MKIYKTKEYRILAAVSGKCLTAGESNLITVEERDDRAEQLWKFEAEDDGSYRLINEHSKKALDIINGGSMNGAWTHLWEPLNTMTQMWVVEEEGDAIRLHSVSSDKYLDVALADNFHVQIWEKGGDNQLWKLEVVEKGPTSIKAKEPSALKHPDPTAIKEKEPSALKHPDPTAIKEKEPSALKHPDPTAIKEKEPSAIKHPAPTAIKEKEPSALKHPDPTAIKEKEPSALKHPDPTAIKEKEPSAIKAQEATEKKPSKKSAKSASKTKSKSTKKSKSKK